MKQNYNPPNPYLKKMEYQKSAPNLRFTKVGFRGILTSAELHNKPALPQHQFQSKSDN